MIRILVLLLICSCCRAQTIEQRVQSLEAALDSSNQEFKSGTVCAAAGATLTIVGALLPIRNGEWDYWKITSTGFGAALMTIGAVLWIDSHKYMGRVRPVPGGVAVIIGR